MKHTVTKLYYYVKTVIELTRYTVQYLFLFTGYKVQNTLPNNTYLNSVLSTTMLMRLVYFENEG